jgi:hypothetical protein
MNKELATSEEVERKAVYVISDLGGRKVRRQVGTAVVHRDGSLSVKLDAIPISGQLYIRGDVKLDAIPISGQLYIRGDV